MTITPPNEEQQHHLQEILDVIGEMYLYLVHTQNFSQDVLHISRTSHPDDHDYVCCLSFEQDDNSLEIHVTVTDPTVTPDDVYGFLKRAETFMRLHILSHYSLPASSRPTLH